MQLMWSVVDTCLWCDRRCQPRCYALLIIASFAQHNRYSPAIIMYLLTYLLVLTSVIFSLHPICLLLNILPSNIALLSSSMCYVVVCESLLLQGRISDVEFCGVLCCDDFWAVQLQDRITDTPARPYSGTDAVGHGLTTSWLQTTHLLQGFSFFILCGLWGTKVCWYSWLAQCWFPGLAISNGKV